jgi:exodeoxyribonuclease VII small subunit
MPVLDAGHPNTMGFSRREMSKKSSAAVPAEPASYEDALAELERLVGAMEAGQLPLDRLLDDYRRAADLLGFCRTRLSAVEQQVQLLEEGQLKAWSAGA